MVLSPQEISSIHLNQNQLSNACIWRFESATGIPIKSIELVKIENGIVQSLSGFSGGKECIAKNQSFSMNPNKLIISNGYNISVLLNKIVIVMTVKKRPRYFEWILFKLGKSNPPVSKYSIVVA